MHVNLFSGDIVGILAGRRRSRDARSRLITLSFIVGSVWSSGRAFPISRDTRRRHERSAPRPLAALAVGWSLLPCCGAPAHEFGARLTLAIIPSFSEANPVGAASLLLTALCSSLAWVGVRGARAVRKIDPLVMHRFIPANDQRGSLAGHDAQGDLLGLIGTGPPGWFPIPGPAIRVEPGTRGGGRTSWTKSLPSPRGSSVLSNSIHAKDQKVRCQALQDIRNG